MTPTRPKNVPESATLIYPGQTFGPGFGVQQATLASIYAGVMKQNANVALHYANAMRDWKANAEIDSWLGLPVPPAPVAPHVIELKITYADLNGKVLVGVEAASGLNYAWVEEN